jgi:16S rRNA (cytosine967-C5)-methyltransferase
VLGRVLRSGAYSNVLLAQFGNAPDERLIRRLVYGTLRQLDRVDRLLAAASDRPLSDMQPGLLDVLRVGAWELRFGAGAAHAAVNEAVESAAAGFGRRAAGFANAVLRRVQTLPEDLPAGGAGRALELGVAGWIYEGLAGDWGVEEAEQFLAASLQPAPRTARRRRPDETPSISGIAGAVEAAEADSIMMDPSSVAVGLAVDARPGMRVLDLAAAPGGKTLHLFDQMEGSGLLVASDRHPRRVASARRRLGKAGVDIPWVVADGVAAPFGAGTFDRVLLDAPCTGLGTLRRRPEIRHRLESDSPGRSAKLQNRLLDAALNLVKPDGVVVYAVCTVFAAETTRVVADRRARAPAGLPGRPAGKGWLLGPHLTGSDGMFISLVRP